MTLNKTNLLGTEYPRLDGGVHIHNLPILTIMWLEDYDLILLRVAVLGISTDTMGESLAHTLI
jgi:hypothetical protein